MISLPRYKARLGPLLKSRHNENERAGPLNLEGELVLNRRENANNLCNLFGSRRAAPIAPM